MLKYTESDFTVKGVKLHYYRTGGDKPPIILLHGATDNGLCWTTTAEVLAEKYDVIMLDAQGHGLSDRLTPGTTFETLSQQVAALAKELELKESRHHGAFHGSGYCRECRRNVSRPP